MSKILIDESTVKLALEALEQWESGCGTTEYLAKVEKAVPVIREALAEQPAQQQDDPLPGWGPGGWKNKVKEQICPSCEESVLANCKSRHGCPMPTWEDHARKHAIKQAEKQEPVVTKISDNGSFLHPAWEQVPIGASLYTPPPAQRKPLTDDLDVKRLNHCMIAVRDWLGGGCDTNDTPRPEIAALVAFTAYGIKENT